VSYRKVAAPKEYEPGWFDQELEKLEQALLGTDSFRLKEWHTVPPKPRLGDVYLADGTDWNPGSGQGAYLFDGSGFVLLGFDGSLAAGSVGTAELANLAVTTGKIADDAVTFAKMQNIATQRVIGRNTASTGDPEEVTILQLLNWLANSNRGDLIRRGASDWETLNVGSNGQVLQSDGTDPVWTTPSAGMVLLTSGDVVNAATLDIVLTAYSTYRSLVLKLSNWRPATDAAELFLRFSTDGGSTYDAGAGNYHWSSIDVSSTPASAARGSSGDTEIQITANGVGANDEEGLSGNIEIFNHTSSVFFTKCTFHVYNTNAAGTGDVHAGGGAREAAQNTDAIRLLFSAGNIEVGNWALYGCL
jgi:hypothetical protein